MTLAADRLAVAQRLHAASVELTPGAVTAIVGPNGAGKSTLLAALAGLVAPDAGAVTLDGIRLAAVAPRVRAQAIGYLPQSREVAWDVTVETLARFGRLPWRSGEAADRAAVEAALAALDLAPLAARPVSRLSGGELARALLARVLAGEPRVILADEPLAGLDLAHQAALLRHFRALAQSGLTVAVVLHDLAAAMSHADRVVVLDRGRIVADGSGEAVLTRERLAETWQVDARWARDDGAWALLTG